MAKIEPIRLQKFIAQCGIASRRKAEELILGGHVKVNGKTAILGDKVLPTDKVFVRGKRIVVPKGGNYRYIMLNKPRGFITTMNDERGRKCVAQLVENVGELIRSADLTKTARVCLFLQMTVTLQTRLCTRKTMFTRFTE